MEFTTSSSAFTDIAADVLIASFFKGEGMPKEFAELDRLLEGRIGREFEAGVLLGDFGQIAVFHTGPALKVRYVVLIGLGEPKDFDRIMMMRAGAIVGGRLRDLKARHAVYAVRGGGKRAKGTAVSERIAFLAQGAVTGRYNPGLYKSEKKTGVNPVSLDKITFAPVAAAERRDMLRAAQEGLAVGEAVNLCRDLVNEPANILGTEELAQRIAKEAAAVGVDCEILQEKKIASLGMNAFLAVSQGSPRPPRLVTLRYKGKANAPTIGLIGKGVVFDTGGISIKPAANMEEMKGDMAGAATVVAATFAAADFKLPVNIVTMTPIVENMPSGTATRPGDIVKARNGKTIEIINTDAEGRLILCDTLSYMSDLPVDCMIDVATLTGGMVVALAFCASGFMTTSDSLATDIVKAADRAGERMWRMPLFPEYREMINSDFADMKNVGGRWGSPVTAGKFLAEFVGDKPWAHIDIAGPSYIMGGAPWRPSGATGEPVRTLVELLKGAERKKA